LLIEKDQGIF